MNLSEPNTYMNNFAWSHTIFFFFVDRNPRWSPPQEKCNILQAMYIGNVYQTDYIAALCLPVKIF